MLQEAALPFSRNAGEPLIPTMIKLPIYQVDAFTRSRFRGNPAAVVPLQAWLPDAQLQDIAAENNLAETAFFIRTGATFHLRWFTPGPMRR